MRFEAYRRWSELYDRQMAGHELSPDERFEMARLAADDRASAHELAVRQQLTELACELDGDASAIVEGALQAVQGRDKVIHLRQPPVSAAAGRYPTPMSRLALAALGLGLAGAAATVALFWSEGFASPSTLTAPAVPAVPVELTFTSGNVRINGQRTVVGALALEPKSTVSVSDGHACLAMDAETDVCLDANTDVVLDDQQGNARTLRLTRGRAVAVLEKRAPERSFSILSGAVTATALGTAFAVEHDPQESTQVTVMEGRVQVARTGDTQRVVHAGEQLRNAPESGSVVRHTTRAENLRHWALVAPRQLWQATSVGIVHIETAPAAAAVTLDGTSLGHAPLSLVVSSGEHQLLVELEGHTSRRDHFRLTPGQERRLTIELPAPSVPGKPSTLPAGVPADVPGQPGGVETPSAPELLGRARALVGQGNWRGAVAAYQRLRTVHPTSAESHTVLVALGQIQLDRLGQPRQALSSFDTYLKTGAGSLAQEARFGSVRALKALGDRPAEAQAIRDYLRQYPRSVDAPLLRRRLAELE